MIIVRGFTAAAVFTTLELGLAVWSAGPAAALGPPPDGMYTFTEAGAPAVTWRLQAICDQVNGSRYQEDYSNPLIQANFCSVDVTSTTDSQLTHAEKLQNYKTRARLVGQLWTFQLGQPDGVSCPDGSTGPSSETYSFDDATLTGTHTSVHGPVCGMQSAMTKVPFQLTLAAPPPSPVQRYPLQCNNIAMCF